MPVSLVRIEEDASIEHGVGMSVYVNLVEAVVRLAEVDGHNRTVIQRVIAGIARAPVTGYGQSQANKRLHPIKIMG